MYIEHRIYHMVYKKVLSNLNNYQFIDINMSKWDGFITFCEDMRNKGH